MLLILILCAGCNVYKGPVNNESRTLYVDFRDTIFNSPEEENPELRGLGIDSVIITVVTEDGNGNEVETAGEILPSDADTSSGDGYSQKGIDISGELVSITAEAGPLVSSISEESGSWDYHGWTVFANIGKVKIDFSVNSSRPGTSYFQLVLCPCGGASPEIAADSGPQSDPATDRGAGLVSGQIALQLSLAEFPADISYDLFTAVVPEDLSYVYNEAVNFEASYEPYPWDDSWSYEEITSSGKQIGSEVYTLTRYNNAPYPAEDPLGDGLQSVLVDLSAAEQGITDKYLLAGFIIYYGSLAVPVDVLCIEIN